MSRPCRGVPPYGRLSTIDDQWDELALSDLSAPELGLGPVPKATLRAHIAERLRAAILAGDIAPGAPLTETALSTRFNVSRGPLREAMRQLIEEGLLVTVPYTGTHVAALSVEDVREIYSLRTALEIFAFEQVWDCLLYTSPSPRD